MQVYRLAGVDPEPVVKTLQDIGNLDPATRIEIDKKNKAIIVYAPLADHVTISAIVKKLSGNERQFEVKQLRRLAADYVAGSIMFMMVGEKKKENTRRSYYDYYGMQQSNDTEKNTNEFRVEADVEHNRLLLWANEVELAEVETLLVKLGEIPPKGRRDNLRVIDARDSKEGQELLDRIRRAWPSISPNPLLMNPPASKEKPTIKSEEQKLPTVKTDMKSVDVQPIDSDKVKLIQFNRETASTASRFEGVAGQNAPAGRDQD